MPGVEINVLEKNYNFWLNRYKEKRVEWHIDQVHPMLIKHLPKLLPEHGTKAYKIFVPLCGKTKDIPFLYSLGHEVFGVESVASVVEELNKENNLGLVYDAETLTYKSEDGRLKIYCGDLFKCPMETFGPFDAIWDRASFIAIDYPLREAYMEVMKRAVSVESGHKYRYLIQTVRYDKNLYPGPPRSVDEEDVGKWFKSWANVQTVESCNDTPCKNVTGGAVSNMNEHYLLLTPNE